MTQRIYGKSSVNGRTLRAFRRTTRHAKAREGPKSDVIQCTEDGFGCDPARTLPNFESHTRSVDGSCEKYAGKCIQQEEVGQQP
jgi:hypothetical protein